MKKNYSHLHRLIIAASTSAFSGNVIKPVIIAKKNIDKRPARATISSSAGSSGSLSNRAKPPMGAM
jgi:hypothetical protein